MMKQAQDWLETNKLVKKHTYQKCWGYSNMNCLHICTWDGKHSEGKETHAISSTLMHSSTYMWPKVNFEMWIGISTLSFWVRCLGYQTGVGWPWYRNQCQPISVWEMGIPFMRSSCLPTKNALDCYKNFKLALRWWWFKREIRERLWNCVVINYYVQVTWCISFSARSPLPDGQVQDCWRA